MSTLAIIDDAVKEIDSLELTKQLIERKIENKFKRLVVHLAKSFPGIIFDFENDSFSFKDYRDREFFIEKLGGTYARLVFYGDESIFVFNIKRTEYLNKNIQIIYGYIRGIHTFTLVDIRKEIIP